MRDHYTQKARKEGFRARSAYKLLQINQKYRLIKRNDDVLDLGCWPGGWIIAAKKITQGRIVGIDLKQIHPIENIEFIKGDARQASIEGKFDVVLSDMAPSTTGMIELDVMRSLELAELAFDVALKKLKNNGNFLVKVFQGEGFEDFLRKVKKSFKLAKAFKPEASKSKSKEMYIVGLGKV
ncbi:MAG: RlmE family RNA methyltransferase [Candidatus Woesearchaeota archaeon]